MFASFRRIIRSGFKGFSRNSGLSAATIFIMVMVIFLLTMLFLFNLASNVLISSIREKVDISVYFKEDILVDDILEVKLQVAQIPEVKNVKYVSQEEALEKFVERHKDDPVLMESLTEVGRNPFLASLNIRAWEASQYEQLSSFLEGSGYKNMFAKVDYYQRKPVIERLFSITSSLNRGGILFSIVLGVIAVLVAFNTVRIAISNSSEEISTMRLVGASNWFIRGPFLIQGVIAGVLATLITLVLTFGICYGLDSKIKMLTPEISTFGLFLSNFFLLLLIQLALGITIGIISSLIATRRYLRV